MLKETLMPKVKELIEERNWVTLRDSVSEWPAPEVADLLLELDKRDRVLLFRSLPRDLTAEVFAFLDLEYQEAFLKDLTDEETRQILTDLSPDDRTELLAELPGQVTQKMLNLLSREDLREARELLGYPEESVGRLMTPDYVAVRRQWPIAHALDHIRRMGRQSETIHVIYVVDKYWKLLDALELERFILADPSSTVEDIMDFSYVSLSAFDDREEAVRLMERYDLFALPVVDSDGVLVGIVTVDDVMDVAAEEVTEDFHKGVAVAPLRTTYREASIVELFMRRAPWLMVLVIVNLASSGVIEAFEETLMAAIALAFFIPLLIDSGGNTGSQSATLMVRALATGDLELGQWWRAVLKEIGVGITLGAAMGLASGLLGLWRGGFMIGVVVGLAMISIVLIANLIGVILPFILTHLKMDPAVASSPLITSIADISGLIIYFSIATWLLGVSRL